MHYAIWCIVDKTRSSELGKYLFDFMLHTEIQPLCTINFDACRSLLFQTISSKLGH